MSQGGFGLGELDMPAPELGGVALGAVGAQKVGALGVRGPLAGGERAAQGEAAGAPFGVVAHDVSSTLAAAG